MNRIFVFREHRKRDSADSRSGDTRPRVYAIPEKKITEIQSIEGSDSYLIVNDRRVEGSFDDLIDLLNTPSNLVGRVDFF